jgi:hypothetical protein
MPFDRSREFKRLPGAILLAELERCAHRASLPVAKSPALLRWPRRRGGGGGPAKSAIRSIELRYDIRKCNSSAFTR